MELWQKTRNFIAWIMVVSMPILTKGCFHSGRFDTRRRAKKTQYSNIPSFHHSPPQAD